MSTQTTSGYLAGQILIAMPQMSDERFARSVVYLCAHNADGAMGIVVNRLFGGITFPQLLEQLDILGAKVVGLPALRHLLVVWRDRTGPHLTPRPARDWCLWTCLSARG